MGIDSWNNEGNPDRYFRNLYLVIIIVRLFAKIFPHDICNNYNFMRIFSFC